jgi:hypothetical protein
VQQLVLTDGAGLEEVLAGFGDARFVKGQDGKCRLEGKSALRMPGRIESECGLDGKGREAERYGMDSGAALILAHPSGGAGPHQAGFDNRTNQPHENQVEAI